MHPVIIVAAYSRDRSLHRLLNSLKIARYPNKTNIKVIISLDGGYSPKVADVAEQFKSDFDLGEVEIIKRDKNIGLRNHIIWCGDQTKLYGSVIILEDDILVDPNFYYYAEEAIAFYAKDDRIGGISLYGQRYNEYVNLPFEPMHDFSSCYLMQIPSSWGQAWTEAQWDKFRHWYSTATADQLEVCPLVPGTVKKWPETSWKKYYSYYLAVTSRYFVYPYLSYSTNCADGGTHVKGKGTIKYQVPFARPDRPAEKFYFNTVGDSVCYDSFMEPSSSFIYDLLGVRREEIEIDFYGSKEIGLLAKKPYVLTTKKVSKYEKCFFLSNKPFENCLRVQALDGGLSGSYIYLADSKSVISNEPPIHILADYLSYFDTRSKKFILSNIIMFIKGMRPG